VPVYLHAARTIVPETSYTQDEAGEVMLRSLDPESRAGRLVRRIYRHSGIEKRHSVIRDLKEPADGNLFFSKEGKFLSPSTGTRNDVYARESRPLFVAVAKAAIDASPEHEAYDVTHVITVSCTGFNAPGPDYFIVRDLGLKPEVRRFHIGFMGCYAAFPALRMAQAFCEADPNAVVLIVCLELCSLHLEPSEEIDDILAFSVFADGAAGVIVSAREPGSKGALRIDALESTIAPDSESDMAWTIGDKGFKMVLSTYVPKVLESNVKDVVDSVLTPSGHTMEDIDQWAIHPGGRAILDHVASGLDLAADALDTSRAVLRDYGNMSSATVLFVLSAMLDDEAVKEDDHILAMAFGPGLTVETGLFTRV